MKTISVDKEKSVVAAKVGGRIYAVSGKCTHWGAPMGFGYLDGYKLLCPWHAAPFDIRTGASLQGPGIGPLYSFPVSIRDNEVFADISVPQEPFSPVKVTSNRKYVIIGGGGAGQACAESLRKAGFDGHVTLLTQSKYLPLDTPSLSKSILTDPSKLLLRPQSFYDDRAISVKVNTKVNRVEPERKLVHCEDGSQVGYDKLFVATGCRAFVPKPFEQAFSSIKGVFTLRDADNVPALQEQIKASSSVVIIGGSFLGMEYATSLRRSLPQVNVTVIEMDPAPLARVFGQEISQQLIQ